MKYSWKGHKDRNRLKNRIKRSGEAWLVYVRNRNSNNSTTWRWTRRDLFLRPDYWKCLLKRVVCFVFLKRKSCFIGGVVIAYGGKLIFFVIVWCRPSGRKRCFRTSKLFWTNLLGPCNHVLIVVTAGVITKHKLVPHEQSWPGDNTDSLLQIPVWGFSAGCCCCCCFLFPRSTLRFHVCRAYRMSGS